MKFRYFRSMSLWCLLDNWAWHLWWALGRRYLRSIRKSTKLILPRLESIHDVSQKFNFVSCSLIWRLRMIVNILFSTTSISECIIFIPSDHLVQIFSTIFYKPIMLHDLARLIMTTDFIENARIIVQLAFRQNANASFWFYRIILTC